MAQMQLKQRLSSDQGGSNFVQALGEELQQAAKGDSWGVSDDHDKGIQLASLNFVLFVTKLSDMGHIWTILLNIYGYDMG